MREAEGAMARPDRVETQEVAMVVPIAREMGVEVVQTLEVEAEEPMVTLV